MKAVQVKKPGGPEVLTVSSVQKPFLKNGWSLIQVLGFGINHSEIFTRQGLSPSVQFPRILGIECVGKIIETTSEQLKVGQTIISMMGEMGRRFDGSYAEYVLIPNKQIYTIQTKLNLESLIALPESYYTAFGSFKNLKITDTDTVLVRGASSGVGIAFARLLKAKHPNIHLSGTTRDISKKAFLSQEGFDDVILDQNNELQTENTFTKIYELVGPKTIKNSLVYLREGGIICSNGQLGGQWYLDDFDPIEQLSNNVYLTSFASGNVSEEKLQELVDFVEKYQANVSPEKIFYRLEDVSKAHKYLESSESFGKVIVKLAD